MVALQPGRRLAVLGAALTLAAGLGCPQTAPETSGPAISDVYSLSPLPQQIAGIRANIHHSLAMRRTLFSAEQSAVAGRIADKLFAPDALEARVLDHLERNQASEHIAATVEWLRTPLGRRFTEAVSRSNLPDSSEEMNHFVAEKLENPLSKERLELVERFDAAANSVEVAGKLPLLSGFTGNMLLNAVVPPADRLPREELVSIVEGHFEVLRPIFIEVAALKTQMALRDFSDADVAAVVRFAESDRGRWYYRVTTSALLDAVEKTAVDMEREFVAALSPAPAG